MTVAELLDAVTAAGCALEVDAGALTLVGNLDPALVAELRAHRDELCAALSDPDPPRMILEPTGEEPPVPPAPACPDCGEPVPALELDAHRYAVDTTARRRRAELADRAAVEALTPSSSSAWRLRW
jgi:hypothetical protein